MAHYTKFIGLDVHKNSIAVAIADSRSSEVRFYGNIPNTLDGIVKLAKQFSEDGASLSFVYEAGPCGYTVHRKLLEAGYECRVVAPSLIPKKAGDRVKTDRRDAQTPARLHRAGEFTSVWVPGPEQEAMRDLSRLREDLKTHERHVKQQLSAFFLRNGRIFPEKSRWTVSPLMSGRTEERMTLPPYSGQKELAWRTIRPVIEKTLQQLDNPQSPSLAEGRKKTLLKPMNWL